MFGFELLTIELLTIELLSDLDVEPLTLGSLIRLTLGSLMINGPKAQRYVSPGYRPGKLEAIVWRAEGPILKFRS